LENVETSSTAIAGFFLFFFQKEKWQEPCEPTKMVMWSAAMTNRPLQLPLDLPPLRISLQLPLRILH
jgi:hypothetical protein